MECEKVQDLLSDYMDGSLPETGRTEVFAHLRDCRICAETADGLENTLRLLKNLPPVPAPPELLERIRRETAGITPLKPLWKKFFLPAHIKIPLEAAAAILVFLLVYGVQKKELPSFFLPTPAARMETAAPVAKSTAEGKAVSDRASQALRPQQAPRVSGGRAAKNENRAEPGGRAPIGAKRSGPSEFPAQPGAAATAPPAPPAPVAQSARPTVPAQRVSTSAERIEPVYSPEEAARNETPFRLFAAPPSRFMRPVPHGREVLLEVPSEERPGLEERIVMAALRHGGKTIREPERIPADMEVKTADPDNLRIMLPAESAKGFLSDLRKLGTVPPEGAPAWADIPAGPRPGSVIYTVRIRVR